MYKFNFLTLKILNAKKYQQSIYNNLKFYYLISSKM